MYLFIFEDGHICKNDSYEEDDISACDEGYLTLIDISDPAKPKEYYDSKWTDVVDINEN
jgi:hypothetical protein